MLLAIAVTAVLGPSIGDVIIALAIVYTPRTARIVRSSVIVLREMEYVQAAIAAGAGHWRILRRHILPNAMAPLIVQLSFLFAYAVLTEATLSFLGVGAVPPTPTWGNIMAEGRQYMTEAPWIIAIPGAALMITVLGLNLLGDGLRDVLDPRLRDPAMTPARGRGPDHVVPDRTRRGHRIEDIIVQLEEGEILGIVGESGSGKSVTALTIMGLLPTPAGPRRAPAPSASPARICCRLSERAMQRMRGPGIAMVFQEPMTSLNPVFTIGEQIIETIRAHESLSQRGAFARAVEMLEKVGIPVRRRTHDRLSAPALRRPAPARHAGDRAGLPAPNC